MIEIILAKLVSFFRVIEIQSYDVLTASIKRCVFRLHYHGNAAGGLDRRNKT